MATSVAAPGLKLAFTGAAGGMKSVSLNPKPKVTSKRKFKTLKLETADCYRHPQNPSPPLEGQTVSERGSRDQEDLR